jgi:hypothetical protein
VVDKGIVERSEEVERGRVRKLVAKQAKAGFILPLREAVDFLSSPSFDFRPFVVHTFRRLTVVVKATSSAMLPIVHFGTCVYFSKHSCDPASC